MSEMVPLQSTRTPAPRMLMSAGLAPYRIRVDLRRAIEVAHEVRSLVEIDDEGSIKSLQPAKTREQRFSIHCDAHAAMEEIPTEAAIADAYTTLSRAAGTEPTDLERDLLAGALLDVLAVQNDGRFDTYVAMLSWKLSDCPRLKTETIARHARWISAPAIVAAINVFIEEYHPKDDRPPAAAAFLDEVGRQSSRLLELRRDVWMLGRTRQRLVRIIADTDDSYPTDDWDE